MLRTPSSVRPDSKRNPLKVFKKGGKDTELAKTAPNTPEDDDHGVTIVANEIDPTRDILSTSTLQQIPSPLRGEKRTTSLGDHRSIAGSVREEKKEDPSVPGQKSNDDVVSKTLNFFDDFCSLPQNQQLENGVQALAQSTIKSHPYLLRHHNHAAFDDQTTNPSLPSETTGQSTDLYTSDHASSHMRSVKTTPNTSTAHNHENFEVVLDPASMVKEDEDEAPTKQTLGNRFKNISKSFKKEKNPPVTGGPNVDDSHGANQLKPPSREVGDAVAGDDDELGRLLAANESSDQAEEENVEEKPSTVVGGPKAGAKKMWKSFRKTIKGDRAEAEEEAPVQEGAKSIEELDALQSAIQKQEVEPFAEETKAPVEQKPEVRDASLVNTLNNMCGYAEEKPAAEETAKAAPAPEEEKQLKMLEAMVPQRQSVEVVNKKSSGRKVSFGRRLKKIQNSAYFKSGKKGQKKTTAKGAAQKVPLETVDEWKLDANGLPKKPKKSWKAVEDPNSGRTYYYHRETRETTWVKPEAMNRYEAAYKRWIDAHAVAMTTKETPVVEPKKETVTKTQEKAPAATAAPVPAPKKAVAEKKVNATVPVVEKNTKPPLPAIKKATKEPKKSLPIPKVKIAEKAPVKETKTRPEKVKPTVDESKPFDEATPFDEPLSDSNGPGLLFLPRSPPRFGRTMTYTSKASARSALTDRTEKVRNTGRGKFSSFSPISENAVTSSGFNDKASRIPSRVPVHRERQLMVEELSDARLNAENYEGLSGERRGRIVRGRARHVDPTPENLYDGDNDTDYGTSHYDNDTYGTDSVSALSENDTDFLNRKDNFDQARRRALDAAIEIEDWDLAAALSDGMKAVNLPGGYEKAHSSWNQSELDKFIANNDWNAVKSYIAKMRVQSKKQQGNNRDPSIPNKRLGSHSQIQHTRNGASNGETLSESSWSGSDSQSSYDDDTYDSESEN